MSTIDRITDIFMKVLPAKSSKPPTSMSGGIGSGHGMVPLKDDMIVSKPAIIFHSSQIFFNFLAMACFASVASFQAKWHVGPSGLSGFAIFVSVSGIFLSSFMLAVPVIYEKYDKFVRLARALKEVRVGFILTGTGTTLSLLIAFIVTISAWTQPGCKNADNDPHSEELGDDFKNGLPNWCNTKKAAAIFFWLTFCFWAASFVLLTLDWRSGKLHAPRDPPFTRPQHIQDEEEGEEEEYTHIPPARQSSATAHPSTNYDNSNAASSPFSDNNRLNILPPSNTHSQHIAAGRPSIDAYGAFSDPAPSGFNTSTPGYNPAPAGYPMNYANASPGRVDVGPPVLAEPDVGPVVSRTMQYADPYAAVRATVSGQPPSGTPPSYEVYQGYR